MQGNDSIVSSRPYPAQSEKIKSCIKRDKVTNLVTRNTVARFFYSGRWFCCVIL
jgi:hypothetical protein